jgi:hypothetical protein
MVKAILSTHLSSNFLKISNAVDFVIVYKKDKPTIIALKILKRR